MREHERVAAYRKAKGEAMAAAKKAEESAMLLTNGDRNAAATTYTNVYWDTFARLLNANKAWADREREHGRATGQT